MTTREIDNTVTASITLPLITDGFGLVTAKVKSLHEVCPSTRDALKVMHCRVGNNSILLNFLNHFLSQLNSRHLFLYYVFIPRRLAHQFQSQSQSQSVGHFH